LKLYPCSTNLRNLCLFVEKLVHLLGVLRDQRVEISIVFFSYGIWREGGERERGGGTEREKERGHIKIHL
jgi:hypothetical protein